MIRFDREITVYVTANSASEIAMWVSEFSEFFGNATRIQGYGSWDGILEHVVLVSHLYDRLRPDWSWYELNNLLHAYKRKAEQETVLTVTRKVDGKLY